MRHSAIMLIICGAACGLGAWIAAEKQYGFDSAAAEKEDRDLSMRDWAPPSLPEPHRIEAPDAPMPSVSPEPPKLVFMVTPEGEGHVAGRSARAAVIAPPPLRFSPLALVTSGAPHEDDVCGASQSCVLPLALHAPGGREGGSGAGEPPRSALSSVSSGLVTFGGGGDGDAFGFGGGGASSGSGGLSRLAADEPTPAATDATPPIAPGGGYASSQGDDSVTAVPTPRSGVLLGASLTLLALVFGRRRGAARSGGAG